jgi:hypothetical protein
MKFKIIQDDNVKVLDAPDAEFVLSDKECLKLIEYLEEEVEALRVSRLVDTVKK